MCHTVTQPVILLCDLCVLVVKNLWDGLFSDFFAALLLCDFALKKSLGRIPALIDFDTTNEIVR